MRLVLREYDTEAGALNVPTNNKMRDTRGIHDWWMRFPKTRLSRIHRSCKA